MPILYQLQIYQTVSCFRPEKTLNIWSIVLQHFNTFSLCQYFKILKILITQLRKGAQTDLMTQFDPVFDVIGHFSLLPYL